MSSLVPQEGGNYGIELRVVFPPDPIMDQDLFFIALYNQCKPFTLTTKERLYSLYKTTRYIIKANIPGDFVECGVWKGGSVMAIALTLLGLGVKDRKIILYDTFTGMTEPTDEDVHVENPAIRAKDEKTYDPSIAPLDEVKNNVYGTGYPLEKFCFIKGKVEDTLIPNELKAIALLRLDTDWYESTKHELVCAYPKLSKGGALIIDDYGAWAGAKKAVDDYFKTIPILLNRIDRDSLLGIKI